MKIAICTQKFIPPLVGGVDVYTDRLSKALERLGHNIMIIALNPTADAGNKMITISPDKYGAIPVWRLKFAFSQRPKESFHYAYDSEMGTIIKNILQEQKPDIFIMMNFYMVTLAPVEAAKQLGITVVHIATDFLPICRRGTFIRWDDASCQVGESIKSCASCFVSHRSLGQAASAILDNLPEKTLVRWAKNWETYKAPHPLWILKPYLRHIAIMEQRLKILEPLRHKIDLIFAPTQYTLKVFLANGFKPEQVHFLPFAVEIDCPLATIKYSTTSHTRFLFVGRLQPYKGAHLLLEAFNNLQSPNGTTLTIYGTPDDGYRTYFNQLKGIIASNEHIRFVGQIAPTDLGDAFAEADFFVLPSTWHENSPLILLDALQSKTPVITSDIGGVTDIVKDGVNGLLFPMGDAQALQQVMQRVIDQPDLVKQLRSGVNLPNIDDYAKTVMQLCRDKQLLAAGN